MTQRKIVYLAVSLAIVAIVFTWWINGAEIEDAWLYLASIGIALSAIPVSLPPKKD